MIIALEILLIVGLIVTLLLLLTSFDFKPLKICHDWQSRGVNRYGITTYRYCKICRVRERLVSGPFEADRFEECDPIEELDAQFDDNDKYKF